MSGVTHGGQEDTGIGKGRRGKAEGTCLPQITSMGLSEEKDRDADRHQGPLQTGFPLGLLTRVKQVGLSSHCDCRRALGTLAHSAWGLGSVVPVKGLYIAVPLGGQGGRHALPTSGQ